jgi:FkbM family methyltransferase
MAKMRALLKRSLPPRVVPRLSDFKAMLNGTYWARSYSQEVEDLILARLFEGQRTGFYVDVGAHHPWRFSNTYLFYRRGWRGINIEPNPESLSLFERHRKRDINLNYGVADQGGELSYFMFNEPALNSFDPRLSQQRLSEKHWIVGTKTIQVRRLAALLEHFLPFETRIDFMSVDVEGYDLKVLESNDWSQFRPTCVLVEAEGFDLGNPGNEPVHRLLMRHDYQLFAKTFNTVFYLARVDHVAVTGKGR